MNHSEHQSLWNRLVGGEFGLATTYWTLYFIGAAVFFVFGSQAVDRRDWIRFLIYVAAQLAYTGILLVGIRAAYRGPQMWKVMSRTSSVFMIINVLVGISALGFIY